MTRKRKSFDNYRNIGWDVKRVAKLYKKENPEWTDEECRQKAKIIVRELKRLDKAEHDNNKKYYSNVIGHVDMDDVYIDDRSDRSLIQDMSMDELNKILDKFLGEEDEEIPTIE